MNQIVRTDIVEEMKRSYIDYAMSVITSRALPDVRDGLKPVHRRILYAMKLKEYTHNKPYKKSARIVGDVMGQFHPHGDSAIYDTMVRLAQPFTMSLPLIDGQGNFGSVDGDPPAAMRYTEARLHKVAAQLLEEIDRDTVDFMSTYDDSDQEPTVLPVMFPQALVNGTTGIAVGMATTILPHNLGEVIDATLLMMANPETSDDAIIAVMPGPDFPSGGLVTGAAGIRDYFATGSGRITQDAVHVIEKGKAGRSLLVFTELPYQVSKTLLEEKITELAGEGKIDGIHAVRDETGRQGTRFVVEVKADADPEVVLSHLRKLTPVRTTFSSNVTVIHHGVPKKMGVRQMIQAWIDFRRDTVNRRVTFDLNKARDRLLLLSALLAVLDSKDTLDWVVDTIRQSPDVGTARAALMEHEFALNQEEARLVARAASDTPEADLAGFTSLHLSHDQAQAILDMRMARLTGLEHEKLATEARGLLEQITGFLAILNDPDKRDAVIVSELQDIRAQFAKPRRSRIMPGEITDMATLDFVPRKDVVITITRQRYAKRQDVDDFRAQNKGGRGKSGIDLKDDDMVVQVLHTNTHADLVIITRCGMAYRVPVHVISDADRGKPLVNYVEQISGDVEIAAILALPADAAEADNDARSLMFVFEDGQVRRSNLSDFTGIRRNGKRATPEGSILMTVLEAREDQDILLASSAGKTIRTSIQEFNVKVSRTSTGVTGMRLGTGETLVAACILDSGSWSPEERAGYLKAVRKISGSEDTGAEGDETDDVIAADISETMFADMQAAEQILVMVTAKSFGKRSSAYEYRATGRATKGYKAMNVSETTGPLIGFAPVAPGQGLMLVTSNGQMIRLRADEIRQQARTTRGTRLFNLKGGEEVFAMVVLPPEAEQEEQEEPAS